MVADETTGSKVAERLVRERITWVSAEGPTESRADTGLDMQPCSAAAVGENAPKKKEIPDLWASWNDRY